MSGEYKTQRYVTAASKPVQATASEPGEPADQPSGKLLSRRTVVIGAGASAAALLCFVLAAGFSGGSAETSSQVTQEVAGLRERIKTAELKEASMPAVGDADRGLVSAMAAAHEVARLQNEYRHLSPSIARADGVLDEDATLMTRRNLIPYFSPSVQRSTLEPWYLLDSDKAVTNGLGIAMSFDSGFKWVAQVPHGVNDDGTIEVTWLATQTRVGQGEKSAVLAWAHCDYDMNRKTFSNTTLGTTATGESLRLAVKGS